MTVVSSGQLLCLGHVGYGNQISALTSLQGYTPEKLPPSSCVMAPELSPPNPAKSLFAKVTKTLFGKKKPKGESMHFPRSLWVTLPPGRSGSCLLERPPDGSLWTSCPGPAQAGLATVLLVLVAWHGCHGCAPGEQRMLCCNPWGQFLLEAVCCMRTGK